MSSSRRRVMARAHSQGSAALVLDRGWRWGTAAAGSPGVVLENDALNRDALAQLLTQDAVVPGTVASNTVANSNTAASNIGERSNAAASSDTAEGAGLHQEPPLDAAFDAHDYWFQTHFTSAECLLAPAAVRGDGQRQFLVCEGLATLADVWLNGVHVARSENMFRSVVRDVTDLLRADNELVLLFAALEPHLAQKRARPRWLTRLVKERNLRFVRTSSLGRMPGFTPPWPAVGPFRPITLTKLEDFVVTELCVVPRGITNSAGLVQARVACQMLTAGELRCTLRVGEAEVELVAVCSGESVVFTGTLDVPGVKPWWPGTHGQQPLYPAELRFSCGDKVSGRARISELSCGRLGFRNVELLTSDTFEFLINGERIFCRGACWTPLDTVGLQASEAEYRAQLLQCKEAGMNMLRLSGNLLYETDTFYRLCDELGILVWQDFMFTNHDYPIADSQFRADVIAESSEFLARISSHCSVVILCGGSEVYQQAAMLGNELGTFSSELFEEVLPERCAALMPGVPYVAASPGGSSLPFRVNQGSAHYFGVGAYRRPISDARTSEVIFASECLSFANVPEPESLALLGPAGMSLDAPGFRERVCRDNGADWDFADVTDHYMKDLFGVEPKALSASDPEAYLELARRTPGEVMFEVQKVWRDERSRCKGALIWFLRDFWLGAGLGLVDARQRAKAPLSYLRRIWSPRAVWLLDQGLNGLTAIVANEPSSTLSGKLRLSLHDRTGRVLESCETPVLVPPRSQTRFSVEETLGHFVDINYSYRFGPPGHHLVRAQLMDADGEMLSEEHFFPLGKGAPATPARGVTAQLTQSGEEWSLELACETLVQSVHLEISGFTATDNYFHLLPDAPRHIRLQRSDLLSLRRVVPKGRLSALNLTAPLRLEVNS